MLPHLPIIHGRLRIILEEAKDKTDNNDDGATERPTPNSASQRTPTVVDASKLQSDAKLELPHELNYVHCSEVELLILARRCGS